MAVFNKSVSATTTNDIQMSKKQIIDHYRLLSNANSGFRYVHVNASSRMFWSYMRKPRSTLMGATDKPRGKWKHIGSADRCQEERINSALGEL